MSFHVEEAGGKTAVLLAAAIAYRLNSFQINTVFFCCLHIVLLNVGNEEKTIRHIIQDLFEFKEIFKSLKGCGITPKISKLK